MGVARGEGLYGDLLWGECDRSGSLEVTGDELLAALAGVGDLTKVLGFRRGRYL